MMARQSVIVFRGRTISLDDISGVFLGLYLVLFYLTLEVGRLSNLLLQKNTSGH